MLVVYCKIKAKIIIVSIFFDTIYSFVLDIVLHDIHGVRNKHFRHWWSFCVPRMANAYKIKDQRTAYLLQ